MAASIVVQNIVPKNNSNDLPLDTLFSFDLFPASGVLIDITTLSIEVRVTGGTTGTTLTSTFTNTSTGVTITGSNAGYHIVLDVNTTLNIKFDENQSILVKIDVDDTLGNSMKQTQLNYRTIDTLQLSAIVGLLHFATEIKVDYEQGRVQSGGDTVDFTWDNWSYGLEPKIYVNDIITTSGYTINRRTGEVSFTTALEDGTTNSGGEILPPDKVNADYHFSAFSQDDLINFMKVALSVYNAQIPVGSLNLSSKDPGAKAAMTIGGAYFASFRILQEFINQQERVKWGEEEWEKLIGVATTAKENYSKYFEKILEAKKHRLANIAAIVIPEYTLPGGRSRFFRYLYGTAGVF